LSSLNSASDLGRTWNDVRAQALVDVDQDTWRIRGVELLSKGTSWGISTSTGDLEVDALRVVLSTICGTSGVKGNDLMTSDIVAWLDSLWDDGGPAVVVRNELVRSPSARDSGVVDETDGIDLEELQVCLCHTFARAVAVGKIGDDRAVMRVRPWGPLELNRVSGSYGSRGLTRCGTEMADDLWCGVV